MNESISNFDDYVNHENTIIPYELTQGSGAKLLNERELRNKCIDDLMKKGILTSLRQ